MLLPLLLLLMVPGPPGAPGPLASGSSLPGTAGECPRLRRTPLQPCDHFCSSDGNCPGSQRCCSTGCGQECRLPTGAKEGFCPRPVPGMSVCLVECNSDSQCPGTMKCCSVGCHVRCVWPVPAKPGVCPKRKVLQTFAPCNNSCTDDADCPGSKKCCFTGCSLGCLSPVTGTTGGGHQLGRAVSTIPVFPSDVCHLPPVPGPCRGRFLRYAYHPFTGTCQLFTYSGCGGNLNNFGTVKECQEVCRQAGRSKE